MIQDLTKSQGLALNSLHSLALILKVSLVSVCHVTEVVSVLKSFILILWKELSKAVNPGVAMQTQQGIHALSETQNSVLSFLFVAGTVLPDFRRTASMEPGSKFFV